MEKYLLIILFLLISLIISFIIVIIDYAAFKKRIEKILDSSIEVNNDTKEVINITKEVNNSVRQICELNNRIIIHLNNLFKENNFLRSKVKDKKEIDEK